MWPKPEQASAGDGDEGGEGEAGAALVVPKEKHNKIKLSEAATAASVAASVTRK